MGWQIEGYRQPHLSSGKIAPVEGVGLLSRRETGILPDCPGSRRIHGWIGSTQKRCRPRHGARCQSGRTCIWRHDRGNGNPFSGDVVVGHVIDSYLGWQTAGRGSEIHFGEIWKFAPSHAAAPAIIARNLPSWSASANSSPASTSRHSDGSASAALSSASRQLIMISGLAAASAAS